MTAGNLTSEGPSAVIDQECKGEYMDRIVIFDTTLRDGEQAPGFSMNVEEKLRLARQLEQLGVDVIEAGFPIASPGDLQAVRGVASEIRGCRVAALARARKQDVDAALEALQPARQPRLHIFLATSDLRSEEHTSELQSQFHLVCRL